MAATCEYNLAELRSRLVGLLGKDQVGDGTGYEFFTTDDLNRALNDAQLVVSRDLWIPRRLVSITATGPFRLPDEAAGTRVLSILVRGEPEPRRLELLTVEEANIRIPGWLDLPETTDPPVAAIYDPGNITAPIWPIPKQAVSREYLVHYVAKPKPMAADEDCPFTLQDPETSETASDTDLTYYVWPLLTYAAYLLWDQVKDNRGAQEAIKYLTLYQQAKRQLAAGVAPGRLHTENSFLRTYLGRRRRHSGLY